MFHQLSQLSRIADATPGVLCLKDYNVVTVDILFASFPLRTLIFFQCFYPFLVVGWGWGWGRWGEGHTKMKCMFIFQSWSHYPWIEQAIHRAAQSDPTTDSPCPEPAHARVRYRGRLDRHFKTRALVWNLAQFVKNVKEEKNTFKAHLLVSTFPTFALYWLFSMTYFLLSWPF